jgi:hypothetical protein
MRKVGVELKANSGSRAERPRWADMRILRRTLMILVMMVLRIIP